MYSIATPQLWERPQLHPPLKLRHQNSLDSKHCTNTHISPMCSNWCLALHIFCMICCYLSHLCSLSSRLSLVALVKHTAVRRRLEKREGWEREKKSQPHADANSWALVVFRASSSASRKKSSPAQVTSHEMNSFFFFFSCALRWQCLWAPFAAGHFQHGKLPCISTRWQIERPATSTASQELQQLLSGYCTFECFCHVCVRKCWKTY